MRVTRNSRTNPYIINTTDEIGSLLDCFRVTWDSFCSLWKCASTRWWVRSSWVRILSWWRRLGDRSLLSGVQTESNWSSILRRGHKESNPKRLLFKGDKLVAVSSILVRGRGWGYIWWGNGGECERVSKTKVLTASLAIIWSELRRDSRCAGVKLVRHTLGWHQTYRW